MDETLNAPGEVTEVETINSNETVIIEEAEQDEIQEDTTDLEEKIEALEEVTEISDEVTDTTE
jgi:tetrahydromethanopterin S-methyltransferase subunit B